MPSVVSRDFYRDPPDLVARNLFGKLLVRPEEGMVGRIVEVEAYFGESDPAAHSFAGKTARNAVLFGPPGHAYVYFVYGMYYCLNVSCEPEGQAGGVLFRALEPIRGLEAMAKNATSGPGRLCKAFGVTRARDNGADFADCRSDLQIQDDGFVPGEILVTPRIGITKAADHPARYLLAGNPYVSGRKRSGETCCSIVPAQSSKLSISLVAPTRAATATNAPGRASGRSSSVSASTIRK